MKRVLTTIGIFLTLVLTGSAFAHAQYLTSQLKGDCDKYVMNVNRGDGHVAQGTEQDYAWCAGFVLGVMNEMGGEYLPDFKGGVIVWNWEANTSGDQLIRVFVKYVNDHPEALSKPANLILWTAAKEAGMYKWRPYKLEVVTSSN